MYTLAILALFGAWIIWEFKSVMKLALEEAPEPFEPGEELRNCA